MPKRPPRPCSHPGCPALVTSNSRCEKHKLDLSGGYNKRKGNRHAQGYGWAWQKLRKQILQRDGYLCQACQRVGRITPATQVDHIIPKAQGGTDDSKNCEAICKPCHQTKTARESRGGAR